MRASFVPRAILTALVAAVAAGLATVAGAEGSQGRAAAAPAVAGTVTASGRGQATAVPDRAGIEVGVVSLGKTASQALAAGSAEMRKVIAALKAAGVAGRDIRTSSLSLSPRYSQDGERILGYAASNTVSVTVRGLERLGATIDAAVEAAAS